MGAFDITSGRKGRESTEMTRMFDQGPKEHTVQFQDTKTTLEKPFSEHNLQSPNSTIFPSGLSEEAGVITPKIVSQIDGRVLT